MLTTMYLKKFNYSFYNYVVFLIHYCFVLFFILLVIPLVVINLCEKALGHLQVVG